VGRMMAARVGRLSKLDHALNAVLMLTHVSQRFQDNLGLLVFSHSVHLYLPPAKGRSQYARFLQALYSIQPELVYVNYRQALEHQGALVVDTVPERLTVDAVNRYLSLKLGTGV